MKRVLPLFLSILLLCACSPAAPAEPEVSITPAKSASVTLETYDNGYISFQFPAGWKVEIPAVDAMHYTFKAYDPENPAYMMLFNMKGEGFLKSELARSTYARYYADSVFARLPYLSELTAACFYQNWNATAEYNNADLGYAFLPTLNDFTVIETLGSVAQGGEVLRASFTAINGVPAQGLFTSTVKDPGSYYINVDIMNPFSQQVDVGPLIAYNNIFFSAPEEEFINWEKILNECICSISFSEAFVNEFNREENAVMQTIQANSRVYNAISDSIMSSWESRNTAYDIMSQKQSDATLGYERVYDTETGDIYKAPNGFSDRYDGQRYQPITEDMYTAPISGYIE